MLGCMPEEPASSCPFAYSTSQLASFLPGPDTDMDALHSALRETERKPDDNIQLVRLSVAQDDEDEDTPHHYPPLASSPSSCDNFTVSSLAVSPVDATEDACETIFCISMSGHAVTSPSEAFLD